MSERRENQSPPGVIPAKKLTVFLVEEDAHHHERLYLAVLRRLREAGIAGATVCRGVEGFGERRVIHSAKVEVLSYSLPIIIEASDEPGKIEAVLPGIAALLDSGLIEVSRTMMRQPASGSPAEGLPGGERC